MNLNDQQLQAVKSDSSHVLVVAGAGAGKTRVLSERVIEMTNRGHSPSTFLCLTFTRKAAGEMKARLLKRLPERDVRKIRCGTFHSVCLDIVKQVGELIGYRKNLSIYDERDREDVLRMVTAHLGLKLSVKKSVAALEATIAGHPTEGKDFQESERLGSVVREYHSVLHQYNALDYSGLISQAVRILEEFPNAKQHYSNIYRHILVDEFQDTDLLQCRLLRALSPESLFLVGDVRQCIYQWRGAQPQLLFEFSKEQEAARYDLALNYRSMPDILELANKVIDDSDGRFGKSLEAVRVGKESELQVETCQFEDMLQEGRFIAERIKWLTGPGGYKPGDIAVLARTNRTLVALEQWFRDSGFDTDFPFVRIGKQAEFWKKNEVRLCVNILKLLHNPNDNQALKSILRTLDIEIPDLKRAEYLARKQGWPLLRFFGYNREDAAFAPLAAVPFCSVIDRYERTPALLASDLFIDAVNAWGVIDFYRQRGLKGRVENIKKAGQWILDMGYTLEEFLSWYAYRDLQDELDEERHRDKVKLLTVHAAKGLEWPVVFCLGLTEGEFPHRRSDSEEERRLFYVATTRAADLLILTCSLTDEYGKARRPSIFINPLQGAVNATE